MRNALLAGWLFADLFLVLLLVGLAAMPVAPPGKAPSATTPPPTEAPCPPQRDRLEKLPVDFSVEISPADFRNPRLRADALRRLIDSIDQEFQERGLSDRRAGFALVFASGPDAGVAQQTAGWIYRALRIRQTVFRDSSGLGYWAGQSSDHLEFKIFFYG